VYLVKKRSLEEKNLKRSINSEHRKTLPEHDKKKREQEILKEMGKEEKRIKI
jgi:hypothetical protein